MQTVVEKDEDQFGANERHVDQLDAASRIEGMARHEAEKAARKKAAPEYIILEKDEETGLFPARGCDDCGDDLAQHRLEAGRARCVPCQDLKERMEKHRYGR